MIVQAEDISYSASGNLRDKQPQRCDPCKYVNHVNDVDHCIPLVKIIYNRHKKGSILKKSTFKYPEFGFPKIPEIVPYFDTDELTH